MFSLGHDIEVLLFWIVLMMLIARWWASRQGAGGGQTSAPARRRGRPRTYYQVLQVDPRADPEVIDAAYRKLAAKHHPDRGGDTEVMKVINEAHGVLGDASRRQEYDRWLAGQLS